MDRDESDSDGEDDSYHGTQQTSSVLPTLGSKNASNINISVDSASIESARPITVTYKPLIDKMPPNNKPGLSGNVGVEATIRKPRHLPGLVKHTPKSIERPRSRSRSPDIIYHVESAIGRVVWTPPKPNKELVKKHINSNEGTGHKNKVDMGSSENSAFASQITKGGDGYSFQAAYTPEGGKSQSMVNADASPTSAISLSERTCIRMFGISYHEIVSKLLMESQVLSEAESRMVLLILSEHDSQIPEVQQRMLDAVVTIERVGISKTSVSQFRKELAYVALQVSNQGGMAAELEAFDVKLTPIQSRKQRNSLDSPSAELEVGDSIKEVIGVEAEANLKEGDLVSKHQQDNLVPVLSQVMHKVAQHISKSPPSGRKQVILVGSGAYNPIHKLHLRMMYIARKYLEERTEYDVLGGLVSPSHATEVRSRYRQQPLEIIPPKHRLAMARSAVGDSTWLTVDPWEITRKRVLDYLSVLEHVTHLIHACFPDISVKVIYLCNSDVLMKLCPESLRSRGLGCLCVCRPQETDRLLEHMGSRWKHVAYVVEDAAILSRELEATTSTRVRCCAIEGRTKEVRAMVGQPVARYISKHSLGAKMGGKERWTNADKEFQLYSGLDMSDMGYESEARIKHRSEPAASGTKHNHRFEVL